MDVKSITYVERDVENIIAKFYEFQETFAINLDKLISLTQSMIDNLNFRDDPMTGGSSQMNETNLISEEQMESIDTLVTNIETSLRETKKTHRNLHSDVSKIGKTIEKHFVADIDPAITVNTLAKPENMMLLHKIIAKHYNRLGYKNIVESLLIESKLPEEMIQEVYNMDCQFAEIHSIAQEIKKRNMTPAMQWASRHNHLPAIKNSNLIFKLQRMTFLRLLENKTNQLEALAYARANFNKYMNIFTAEITELMGCFIYLQDGIENSPYKYLVMPEAWITTAYVFEKEACHALAIRKNSNFSIVFNVGCIALPVLRNIGQVMENRDVLRIWTNRDELPVEIDLNPENRYHSVFACPILRQQSSERNPPRKLLCGHIISNDALLKLKTGLILKCPYCPMQQGADDCVTVHF